VGYGRRNGKPRVVPIQENVEEVKGFLQFIFNDNTKIIIFKISGDIFILFVGNSKKDVIKI